MRNLGPLRTAATLLVMAFLLLACGSDRSGGPRGDAATIVARAPDRTVAARTARVATAITTAVAEGTVDFTTAKAEVRVRPPEADEPELRNPALALDIVRAVVSVRPYGGAEVRGASTIKYEVDVAPSEALEAQLGGGLRGETFYADIYIDSDGRIRRVSLPIDLNEPRPSDRRKILAKLVTIDFFEFGMKERM